MSAPGAQTAGCRSCGATDLRPVVDLGMHPLASHYPAPTDPAPEAAWPLRAGVCADCWLVQLLGEVPAEPQSPGSAPAAHSSTMREHVRVFAHEAAELRRGRGLVVEVASHGGYLHEFLREDGIESLVVEGSPALANDLEARGIPHVAETMGPAVADRILADRGAAAVVVDNYLLSHVADPNDLLAGMRALLAPDGHVLLELDHVLPTIVEGQFDSFRHGHYTYWSLHALLGLLRRHDLEPVSVVQHEVYGGALRVVACRTGGAAADPSLDLVLAAERAAGLDRIEPYLEFGGRVERAVEGIHAFLDAELGAGHRVAGYGAPTRGATLLNAAHVTPELLAFTVDRSPSKQGRLMPGSRVPIRPPEALHETGVDVVLILTWDIRDEVVAQLSDLTARGVRLVVPVPDVAAVAS